MHRNNMFSHHVPEDSYEASDPSYKAPHQPTNTTPPSKETIYQLAPSSSLIHTISSRHVAEDTYSAPSTPQKKSF